MGELSGLAEWWLVHGEWELGGELSRERLNPWLLTREAEPCLFFWIQKIFLCWRRPGKVILFDSLWVPERARTQVEALWMSKLQYSTCPDLFYHRLRDEKGKWLVPHPLVSHGKIRWKHGSLTTTPSIKKIPSTFLSYTHKHAHIWSFKFTVLRERRRLDFSSVAKQTSETVFTLREKYESDACLFIKNRR